ELADDGVFVEVGGGGDPDDGRIVSEVHAHLDPVAGHDQHPPWRRTVVVPSASTGVPLVPGAGEGGRDEGGRLHLITGEVSDIIWVCCAGTWAIWTGECADSAGPSICHIPGRHSSTRGRRFLRGQQPQTAQLIRVEVRPSALPVDVQPAVFG